MARLSRVMPVGIPQHIIQRGNNRQVCFADEADMKAYLGWLKEFALKCNVDVHAWVLMTNHVHLLCAPRAENAISLLMQSLGRMYVRYFNYTYGRTGSLWEGRFKSCVVQSEEYLYLLYRYIELNPVRAKMVNDPGEYSWSSYQINALGKSSKLCTPHALYLALGANKYKRLVNYRALFNGHIETVHLGTIRKAVNKGLALGDSRFANEIEQLTQQRVTPKKAGRPRLDREEE